MTEQKESASLIFETQYWKVILSEDQTYLGRAVVVAKEPNRPSMSDLTTMEWLDFAENVVKPYEKAVASAFGAELFNWSCLMNNAYQDNPPKPHVHWHVKPRYRQPVWLYPGTCFEDDQFGHHYTPGTMRTISDELRSLIVERIRNRLPTKHS